MPEGSFERGRPLRRTRQQGQLLDWVAGNCCVTCLNRFADFLSGVHALGV